MKNKQNKILNSNYVLFILTIITTINVLHFFYIKNETHYLKVKINQLSNDLLFEQRSLSIKQTEFNKKYNVQKLQELSKNRLKLQFSNVNQITTFEDVLRKKPKQQQ